MSDAPVIVGIDLGTTNSLVAVCENSKARILYDGDSPLIPSVIAWDETGNIQAVGHRAKTLKSIDPKKIIYSVKRLMGRGKSDLEEIEKELPFDFSESTDEMLKLKLGSRIYTPIELSSEILKRCKFVAENNLGFPVRKAVVTVPAYFNDAQRSATVLAGKLAGLEVVRILNEPTAAALAYGVGNHKNQEIVAVYDFGGGTFDISILKITGGVFEVLSTSGDTHLGGDDLDSAIYDWLTHKIKKAPEKNEDQVLLRTQIEHIKIALTEQSRMTVNLQWGGQVQWSGDIDRSDIEEVLRPIIQKTIQHCAEAVSLSGVAIKSIAQVLMVGGSSRLPLVRKMVELYFNQAPNVSMNPDEAVALGASMQASILSGEISGALLLDVVPLSLGLETMGGLVSKVVPRNTKIPTTAFEMFTTYADFQTAVDLHIVQGEREFAKDCRSLGNFKLRIAKAPAGIPKFKVTFLVDANGVLRVTAVDEKTGEHSSLEVKPSFGLSDQEVERMLQDAWASAESDFKERQLTESRNQARALIQATEKFLLSPLIDSGFKQIEEPSIRVLLKALTEDLKGESAEVIARRTKELDAATHGLAQHLLSRGLRMAQPAVERVSI